MLLTYDKMWKLLLAQKGYKVDIYEGRPDLREDNLAGGKSINLALSERGWKALKMAGIDDVVSKNAIPMRSRCIHMPDGTITYQPYGKDGQAIYSVSRGGLNKLLMTAAEKLENVNLYFSHKCDDIDLSNNTITFNTESGSKTTDTYDHIIGADGAFSAVRTRLQKTNRFDYSQTYLEHGYKELEIPAKDGKHQIDTNALHIWPRGDYMLIALPNLDGSFTVTLFLGHNEGDYHFEGLQTEAEIKAFFEAQFPDALQLIPDIAQEFANNPTGALGTVKCSPWYYQNKTLLMGDACHAVVPFYGQGMNASFEDVTVLDSVLNEIEGDWNAVFKSYQNIRKKDADAIGDLAVENYYEMRDHVANPLFKQKRQLEMQLEEQFPEAYFSKYSMVTFNEDIGYNEAMTKGRAQDKAILNMIADGEVSTTLNLTKEELREMLKKVQQKTNEILEDDRIAGL